MSLTDNPLISLLVGLPLLGDAEKSSTDILRRKCIQNRICIDTRTIIKGQIDIGLIRIIINGRFLFLELFPGILQLLLKILYLLLKILPVRPILL